MSGGINIEKSGFDEAQALEYYNKAQQNQQRIESVKNDFQTSPEQDEFVKSENKTAKTAGVIGGLIATAAVIVGAICLKKGGKALEGKDASLKEKLEAGWKELRGKGEKGIKETQKTEEVPKADENPKGETPKADEKTAEEVQEGTSEVGEKTEKGVQKETQKAEEAQTTVQEEVPVAEEAVGNNVGHAAETSFAEAEKQLTEPIEDIFNALPTLEKEEAASKKLLERTDFMQEDAFENYIKNLKRNDNDFFDEFEIDGLINAHKEHPIATEELVKTLYNAGNNTGNHAVFYLQSLVSTFENYPETVKILLNVKDLDGSFRFRNGSFYRSLIEDMHDEPELTKKFMDMRTAGGFRFKCSSDLVDIIDAHLNNPDVTKKLMEMTLDNVTPRLSGSDIYYLLWAYEKNPGMVEELLKSVDHNNGYLESYKISNCIRCIENSKNTLSTGDKVIMTIKKDNKERILLDDDEKILLQISNKNELTGNRTIDGVKWKQSIQTIEGEPCLVRERKEKGKLIRRVYDGFQEDKFKEEVKEESLGSKILNKIRDIFTTVEEDV